MRLSAAIAVALALASCAPPSTAPLPTLQASASREALPTGSPSAISAIGPPVAGVYGLLHPPGKLEMIRTDGTVAATVPMAEPSPQYCGAMGAWTLPGVSASDRHVYFRDGDTRVRVVIPPSSAADVTTVPGGTHVISGFSVSPDDARIAVSVENLTNPSSITQQLYVEDLRGHTHHVVIYTATAVAGKGATMLWPMGWHGSELVLAVWSACAFEPVPYPNAWHVADSATAVRRASIGDANCIPASFPSPAGVACFAYSTPGHVKVFNWNGTLIATLTTDTGATALSPSGHLLALGSGGGLGDQAPSTIMLRVDGGGVVNVAGHIACLWIDDGHVLAQDGVIAYPSGAAAALPQAGQCAGRFPGGL